jgi:16S rRNA (uracil1498-N3)-methyltransferase
MNLILLFESDFQANATIATITGRRLNHVLSVCQARVGDELVVGLLNGKTGRGKVLSINQSMLELEVKLVEDPPEKLPLTLLLALPRPKMLKRILAAVSSLGVKNIYLINSYRVEKSFWGSPLLTEENLKQYLMLGLEQACDTVLPGISLRPLFKPFIEDEVPRIIRNTMPILAHPIALATCPYDIQKPATIAIGPEGGFIPYEIEKFIECGFMPVNMGKRILRVEIAVTAIISKLF